MSDWTIKRIYAEEPESDGWDVAAIDGKPISQELSGEQKLEAARRQYGQELPSRGYLGETLHSLGTMLTDTIPKATAQMIQGSNVPASDESGLLNRFIAEQDRDLAADIPSKEYVLGKGAHRSIVEGIQGGGASLPVSLAGFGTGLAAGAALPDPTPFGRIAAGTGAAMATSGAMMYRMAKNEFLRQVRDSLIKKQGQLDPAEWEGIKNEIDSQATQYGIWEAGPEALSEGLEFLIFKAPVGKALTGILGKGGASKILNNTLARVGGKYVGMLGAEVPTEAFTQVGQKQLLAEQGIGEQPKGGFASQYGQALKEVAGPTAVTTAMLGGGYKALDMIGGKKAVQQAQPTEETTPQPAPTEQKQPASIIEGLRQGLHAGRVTIDEAVSWKPELAKQGVKPEEIDAVINDYKAKTGKKDIDQQLDEIFGKEGEPIPEHPAMKEPVVDEVVRMELDRKRKAWEAKKLKEEGLEEPEGGLSAIESEAEELATEKRREAKEMEAQHLHGKRDALSRETETLISFAESYANDKTIPKEIAFTIKDKIAKAKMKNTDAIEYLYGRFKNDLGPEFYEPPEIRIAKEQAELRRKIKADRAEKGQRQEVKTEIVPESVVDRINEQRPELGLVYQGIQPGAGKAPASHQFYFTEPNTGKHPNIGVVDLSEENLTKAIDGKIEEFKEAQEKIKAKTEAEPKQKEPWEMTRDEYYKFIRETEGPSKSNVRNRPDWDAIKKQTGIEFVVENGNEIQPILKQRRDGGFTKTQEQSLKDALSEQGFAVDKFRVRNQEEQDIPIGGGWRARSRDVFPTSPEHERFVKKAISEGKIKSHPDYPELTEAKPPQAAPEATERGREAESIEEVRDLANMLEGQVSAAVFLSLQKGDSFKVGRDKEYTVQSISKPKRQAFTDKNGNKKDYEIITYRIKSQDGETITSRLHTFDNGNSFFVGVDSNNRHEQLSRAIEGDISVDLVNEFNPFHNKSDSYRLADKYLKSTKKQETKAQSKPSIEVSQKPEVGRAWVNNQFRPILQAREIKKGKNKGKVQVVLPGGKTRMVEMKDVREWPGKKEEQPKAELKKEAPKKEVKKTDQVSDQVDNIPIKQGDQVTFAPKNPKNRVITGIVAEEIKNIRGDIGYHVLTEHGTDRVWLEDYTPEKQAKTGFPYNLDAKAESMDARQKMDVTHDYFKSIGLKLSHPDDLFFGHMGYVLTQTPDRKSFIKWNRGGFDGELERANQKDPDLRFPSTVKDFIKTVKNIKKRVDQFEIVASDMGGFLNDEQKQKLERLESRVKEIEDRQNAEEKAEEEQKKRNEELASHPDPRVRFGEEANEIGIDKYGNQVEQSINYGRFQAHLTEGVPTITQLWPKYHKVMWGESGSLTDSTFLIKKDFVPKTLTKRAETLEAKKNNFPSVKQEQGIFKDAKGGGPLEYQFTVDRGDNGKVAVYSDKKGKAICINESLVRYFGKTFKDFNVKGKVTDTSKPVELYSGKQLVGIVMPLDLNTEIFEGLDFSLLKKAKTIQAEGIKRKGEVAYSTKDLEKSPESANIESVPKGLPSATPPPEKGGEQSFSTRLDTAISKGASRIASNEIAKRSTERRSGDRRREVFNERYGRTPERRVGIERRKPSVTETAKDRIAEYGANLLKKQALDNLAFFKQVKTSFPKQTVRNNGDGTFTVATRWGEKFTVKSVKQVSENKVAFEVAYGRPKSATEQIAGAYYPSTDTIEIVKGVGDRWTVSHESFHRIKKLGKVTAGESKAIDAKIRAEKKDPTYKPTEEDQARWIEKALPQREKYRGTTIGKILQRLGDLIDSFVNLFHATSRSVLRGMESGKIYDRGAKSGINEFAQSVKLSVKQAAKNIMENPNFRKWFKGSKVVDAEGKPLVVYHGTLKAFDEFDHKKSVRTDRAMSRFLGHFFVDNEGEAKRYAEWNNADNGRILPVYLSIQNPYKMPYQEFSGMDMYTFNKMEENKFQFSDEDIKKWNKESKNNINKLRENLISQGYDGIFIERSQGNIAEYVAFHPTQIKSIHNLGTFDSKNPNILYSAKNLLPDAISSHDFLKTVKQEFKRQTVKDNGDGTVTVATRSGEKFTVKSVKQVSENKAAFEIAYGRPKSATERIAGAYYPSADTIEIVKGVGDRWTVSHESFHRIKKLGKVTAGESKAIDAKIRAEKKDPTYKPTEEDQARWIEKALPQREKYRGTTIGKILQRLGDLIDSFVNLFKATSRSVLRGMESGKIYERGAKQGINEFAQSVKLSVKQAAKNIMENPNFRKWFKGSKVVDAEGKPLVVYHGSDTAKMTGDFSFQTGRKSKRYTTFSEHDVESIGFFFSPNEGDAGTYGDNVSAFYLSARNPLQNPAYLPLTSKSPQSEKDAARKAWEDIEYILAPAMYEEGGARYIDTEGGVSRTEVDDDAEWLEKVFASSQIDWALLDNPEVVRRMKERGYDSVMVYEPNDEAGYSWFVTDPTQIKSIFNRGTFDPKNPNILYQVVYHGTMHIWPPEKGFPHGRPRLDKVGSGEGGAAFGHGFYMADAKDTGTTYRQIILDNYDNVLLDGSVATVDRMAEVAKDIIGLQRARTISKDALSRVGKLGSVEVAIKEIEGLQADRSMQKFPDVSWELSKQKELLQALGDRIKTTGEFGSLYTLDIPDSIIPQLLNWDKKVSDAVLDKIERSTKNKAVLNVVASTRKDNHFKLKPNLRSKYALPEVLRIIKTVGFTEDEITLVLENDGKAYEALTRRFPDLDEDENWAENIALDVWGVTSIPPPKTGGDLYNAITRALDGNQQEASEIFRQAGIPGNKYLDQFSREKGEGTYNYVIWDQKVLDKIALLERNGKKLDEIRKIESQIKLPDIQFSTKLDPKLQAFLETYGKPKEETPTKSQAKSWLRREAGYQLKNLAQLRPKNRPALDFWEQVLKSPEWWDHENIIKIVEHAINRHDIFSENFNELIEDPLGGEGNLLENIQALKYKGLSRFQRMTGKVSRGYSDLMNMLDEGDSMSGTWNADMSLPVSERVEMFEKYQRAAGMSEETIKAWKSIRSAFDSALDKMIEPMVKILEKKKEEAAFSGKSGKELDDVDIPDFISVFDEYKQEKDKKSLKEVIAEMESWRGFYAPRIRRHGKWSIRARRGAADFEERFFDMAPTRGAAERIADQLKSEGYEGVRISETKRLPEEVYQHVSVMATEELLKKASEGVSLDDSSIIAKFQEQLIQQTADLIRVRGYRGSMVHRKEGEVVKGYIADPLERTSRYLANTSAGLAKAETASRMVKELAKIDAAGDSRAYAAAQRYIEEQLRNADSSDRVIGIAKSVATFKYLGLPNIRAPFVNLTAMLTTVPAAIHQYTLNGKGNFAEIFAAVGKAGKDYAKFMTSKNMPGLTPDEIGFLNEIKRKNYDDPQYTRDALGTMQALHGKFFTQAMNGSMWLFGKTEQWNRGATLLAAYRMAKKHGMNEAEAREAAVKTTGKAHGIYGKATLPALAQGKNPFSKIVQMAYTYQKFGHNWLQMCYDLGLKKKNIRAFMWAMSSPIVLGGAMAIPFKAAAMGMLGFMLKSIGEDRDPEKFVWDTINEHLGSTAEKAMRYGVVGMAGGGADVTGSFSVDPGVPKNMVELTGAIGGVVGDLGEVIHQFIAGKPLRGLEALLPTGASSMIKAARESKEGASTRWGNRVFDERNRPYMPTAGETTLRALGFRSARMATVQAKQWEQKKEIKGFSDRRSRIYEKLKAWQMQKPDMEKLKEILQEIFEYNKNVIESGNMGIPLITKQAISGINRRQAIPSKAMRAIEY